MNSLPEFLIPPPGPACPVPQVAHATLTCAPHAVRSRVYPWLPPRVACSWHWL